MEGNNVSKQEINKRKNVVKDTGIKIIDCNSDSSKFTGSRTNRKDYVIKINVF